MSDLLNSASLVMIPSGYAEDKVYSVVPSDGSGDMAFTRASNGTRVNSAGLVEVTPWNLVQYSEDFSNGAWYQNNTTVNTNVATAPNGTMTADRLTATANLGSILQATTQIVQIYTESIWVKSESGTVNGSIFGISSAATRTDFVATTTWQRITNTATSLGGTRFVEIRLDTNGTSILIWGAQLNIGATAKPYFPTTDRLNVPRLTYQNGGGGCPSLLLEKQSTNLALYSEQFNDASWNATNTTISANATISPDGTQNADNSITVSSNGTLGRSFSIPANSATYTQSVYVKWVSGYESFMIRTALIGGTSVSGFTIINCKTGVVISSDTTNKIESVGNGWFRLSHQLANNGTNTTYIYQIYNTLDTAQTQTISLWGAQVEQSSYPTSYIPTTSSSATRVADACFKDGLSVFGTNQGTFFVDSIGPKFQTAAQYLFDLSDNSAGNRFALYSVASNELSLYTNTGNNFSADVFARNKIAISWNGTTCKLYMNGTQMLNISCPTSNPTSINLNSRFNDVEFGDSQFNEVVCFPTALTATELASLTTI